MSSKINTQMKILMSNPKYYMEFHTMGKMPPVERISSPLITYLESKTIHERLSMSPARTHPTIGYIGTVEFNNAEQLYRWLKPSEWIGTANGCPSESRRIKSFNRVINDNLYNEAQKKTPLR